MAEHPAGGAAAQQGGVVDAVPAREHGVEQGQQLAPWPVRARSLAQVDQRVGGLLDAQPLSQRGRQQQARVGDRVGVVKADVELVEGVGGSHREPALLTGEYGSFGKRHSPSSEGLSHNRVGTISITGTVHPG
jgi:hypothetical protein